MAEKFSNVFQTRLTVAMDASTTSMTVADAAPVALRSGEARFRLGDELLIATIPADGVPPFTVVRGAEGTVALAHAVHPVFGVVRHVLTAGSLSALVSAGVAGVTKASLGLGSVDNTADSAKPVSTAQQTALDAKAPTASPTFTGTVVGVTKAHVGLGSVDNTSDAGKPVSTAQQSALDAKAPLASPALTGNPTVPTQTVGNSTTRVASTAFVAGEVGLDRTRLDSVESDQVAETAARVSGDAGKAAKATLPINVTDYGVLPGLGDQSAGWATVVAKLIADQGGTVVFPRSTLPYRIDTFTIPNDGATNSPTQYPMRLTGEGSWASGRNTSPGGGAIIDLGASTGAAKIDTRGIGLLMIDHLTFREPNAATTTPFIQATNTTLQVTDCAFIGHSSKAGVTCDQDAILLGGGVNVNPGGIGGSNASDAAFQGYGTRIEGNTFHRIRRLVRGRRWANAANVRNNWAMHSCGTNLADGAAIEFDSETPGDTCAGNIIEGNQIEMIGYVYAVKLANAVQNHLGPNGFYDPTAATLAYYRFEDGATYNLIVDGFRSDAKPLVSESAAVAGSNSYITGHQAQTTRLQYLNVDNAIFRGPTRSEFRGNGGPLVQPTAAQSNGSSPMFTARRSAAEGVSPSVDVFEVRNGNGFWVGDAIATPSTPASGVALYVTAGFLRAKASDGNVHTLTNQLTGTVTWDPGSIADGATVSQDVTVTGAAVGDVALAGHPQITVEGAILTAKVSATNTVKVTLYNKTGAPLDIVSGTLRAVVFEF